MRRIAIVLAVAALAVSGAPAARAGGGGGCYQDRSSQGNGTKVDLAKLCFEPTVINVRRGETVTWTNKDDIPHTVTGMPGTFDSEELRLGDTFSHRFTEAGTFAYYCVLHRRMAGAVVVAGEISKAGLGASSGGVTTTGSSLTGTKTASKPASSSAAAPITALAIAIPVAAAFGFGAGRRGLRATPS